MEILWQHEDADCALIASDVVQLSDAADGERCHIRCALFGAPTAASIISEYSVSYADCSTGISRTQVVAYIRCLELFV